MMNAINGTKCLARISILPDFSSKKILLISLLYPAHCTELLQNKFGLFSKET